MPSYTAVEKENALRLCDEIGVSKASKETGVSRHTLYKWRAGAEDELATPTAEVDETPVEEVNVEATDKGPSRKRYTVAEKEKALRLYDEVGVSKASKMTGITINSLRKWRADAQSIIAAVEETHAEEAITEADNESTSIDIIARLAKSPADEATSEEKESHENINTDTTPTSVVSPVVDAAEELIRLRIENSTLRAQIATLKNALRVFTE